MEVVPGAPRPPVIFDGRNLPQQTIYRWKGNLSKSPIHFRCRQIFSFRDFMSNFREMTPQWLQKKFQTFKI